MFAAAGYGAARARYRTVDLDSRVEAASPHRLVAILFEELTKTLEILAAGVRSGGAGVPERRSRANTILMGLETSLDHAQGGELARGLAAIYRQARRLVAQGCTASDAEPIGQAQAMIAEIAAAWAQIG